LAKLSFNCCITWH